MIRVRVGMDTARGRPRLRARAREADGAQLEPIPSAAAIRPPAEGRGLRVLEPDPARSSAHPRLLEITLVRVDLLQRPQ